nr:alpha/beta hydrolase [Streptomyces sp. 8K308]
MRAGVNRLLTALDLHDVTLVGESMGAVLALTTAADLPERVRRVVAVNAYDFRGGIARSGLLARVVVSGVLTPRVGPVIAGVEPKPALRRILQGGLGDKSALRADYVDELLQAGGRPGYPTVAPGACIRTCPASSRPARATPRSRCPSTSSTARRTGPGPQTGKPTSSCCRPPTSRRFRE